MTLVQQINNLATRLGTEFKAVRASIGTLASLTTTDKSNLVAAVNEVNSRMGDAGAQIDDATVATTTVWSSSKVKSVTDGLRTDVDAHTAALAARPVIDDATAGADKVYSSSRTEARIAAVAATKPGIDDTTASTTTVFSSTETANRISAAVAALVDGAPGALDTLNELAAALGDDPNAIASVTTSLTNRVRVDAAQAFDAGQQAQGRANIGAQSAADVGDTATDFVAVFNAALA